MHVEENQFRHLDLNFYQKNKTLLEQSGRFRFLGDTENTTITARHSNVILPVMIRSMVSMDGTVSAILFHLRLKSWWSRFVFRFIRNRNGKTCEFETEFSNGCFICTSNAASAGKLSMPSRILTEFHPTSTSIPALLSRHHKRLQEYSFISEAIPLRINSQEEFIEMQHRMQIVKAQYREEIGIVTKAELDAIHPNRTEINEKIFEAIQQLRAEEKSN